MAGNHHVITVHPYGKKCPIRKKKFKFALFDRGNLCGSRLMIPEESKPKKAWPFKGDDWMFADTKEAAEGAAKKLQSYLDSAPLVIPETRPNR